jgi:hypothetical protein
MSSAFEDIRSSESNSDYKGGRARSNSTTKKDAILNGSAPMAVILNDSGAGTTERLEVKIERTNLNERELKQLRKVTSVNLFDAQFSDNQYIPA